MIRAWYEKSRDQKDHVYFAKHYGTDKSLGGSFQFPAFHNSIEIAVCLEGDLDMLINDVPHVLHAGEVCFLNSFDTHRYFYNPSVVCYVVLISQSFFTDVNQWGSLHFSNILPDKAGFSALKQYLDYAFQSWDGESLLFKRAFADTMAYLMARYYQTSPEPVLAKQSANLLLAVKYICEHYTDRLTVGGVAEMFGYSPNYFSSAFNEFMGSSFPDYLNACRMIEYYRICRKDAKISAVRAAEACGFGSMNTFYRAQKRFLSEEGNVVDPPRKEAF